MSSIARRHCVPPASGLPDAVRAGQLPEIPDRFGIFAVACPLNLWQEARSLPVEEGAASKTRSRSSRTSGEKRPEAREIAGRTAAPHDREPNDMRQGGEGALPGQGLWRLPALQT